MDTNKSYKKQQSGRAIAGLIILGFGLVLLLNQLGIFFPHWFFGWHTFLIVLGIFIGVRNQWRNLSSFFLIFAGAIYMIDDIFPEIDTSAFLWPVIIISIGLFILFGRKDKRWQHNAQDHPFGHFNRDKKQSPEQDYYTMSSADPAAEPKQGPGPASSAGEDYIDSISVFGATKKNVFSKNFRGGDIVTFMGGTEINLSQADINGRVELDVTQIFGGTKIVVPPHWEVHSEMAAIFGGVEDKRHLINQQPGLGKVLVIKGTSVFGGIDIRSY